METPLWTDARIDHPRFLELGRAADASLLAENRRLRAALATQHDEIRRTKERLVEASDAARRRVERDLHDGAQQRIVALTLALRLLRTQLAATGEPEVLAAFDRVGEEARAALAELRDLARGIHPAVLSQAGLTAALESLGARSTVPAVIRSTASRRYGEATELAAYFLVSEALANAAKHSGASRVDVTVSDDGGRLIVEIEDDGCGGAELDRGSGLRGLVDRIEAVGGRLHLRSRVGAGTRIRAIIPVPPGGII